MSDPESGSRSDSSSPPRTRYPINKMSCPVEHYTQLNDIAVAIEVDSGPTRSENIEVDVSKEFLAKTLASMASAAPTRSPPSIYKVPKELKRGDEDKGFEPVAVRIGPFTKNNNNTAQLEKYKWCCVRQLMGWDQDHPDSHVTAGLLNSCLESMKHLEPQIRASYCEDIEHNSDDLALNMLLDGCFILHRLVKYARLGGMEAQSIGQDDDWTQVFGRVWVWQLVAADQLLLENQIPFFVLSKLFELLCGDDEPKDALVKGSLRLFRSLCRHMLQRSASEIDYHGVDHLLHLFYLSLAGPGPTPQPSESDNIKHSSCWRRRDLPDATRREHPKVNTDIYTATVVLIPNTSHQAADDLPQWIPCAKELEEAGVQFRKRKEAESFLDIEFDSRSGVLKIPPLHIFDFSEKLFRNLIAFEQTYPYTRCDITTYAAFINCLINTPEDMRILRLSGILVNQINGEQDACHLFSRICAQVRWLGDRNHLKDVIDEVNNYRGSRLHKWRAALVGNYFSNPWVAMSVLAAVLLLAMTILQTTFTAYPCFNPPK